MVDSGINVPAELPNDVVRLKFALNAWRTYSIAGKEIDFRTSSSRNHYEVDDTTLERNFIASGTKVFIEGDKLEECRDISTTCRLLTKYKFMGHQLKEVQWLNQRIDWRGDYFFPRWIYFNQ